jgi:hypothetical protein
MNYDKKYDAEKWIYKGTRPQIYSYSPNRNYAINGIPLPETSVDIPLAFRAPVNGKYSISQIQLEGAEGYVFYLKDLVQNTKIKLNNSPKYSFSASEGTVRDRFILTIENASAGINDKFDSGKPFNVYSSKGYINIELMSDIWDGRQGSVKVIDLAGRTLIDSPKMQFSRSSVIQLPTEGNKGLFIIELSSNPLRHVTRVVIK